MKKFIMEGINCIYLFKDDYFGDKTQVEGREIIDFPSTTQEFVRLKIEQNEAIRIVLVESRRAFGVPVLEAHILLAWDKPEIDLIDSKISTDTHTDNEFKNTILAKHQKTFCTHCNWIGHTLVVHIDTMNPQLSKVLRNKLQHYEYLTCQHCKNSLRQPVVYIFKDT